MRRLVLVIVLCANACTRLAPPPEPAERTEQPGVSARAAPTPPVAPSVDLTRCETPFLVTAPPGTTCEGSSRYGLDVVTVRRAEGRRPSSVDVTRFAEPMPLARFLDVSSRGRGFLESLRREEDDRGFILVTTRQLGSGSVFRELAVGHTASSTVCMATDLHEDAEVTAGIALCRGLRFGVGEDG